MMNERAGNRWAAWMLGLLLAMGVFCGPVFVEAKPPPVPVMPQEWAPATGNVKPGVVLFDAQRQEVGTVIELSGASAVVRQKSGAHETLGPEAMANLQIRGTDLPVMYLPEESRLLKDLWGATWVSLLITLPVFIVLRLILPRVPVVRWLVTLVVFGATWWTIFSRPY